METNYNLFYAKFNIHSFSILKMYLRLSNAEAAKMGSKLSEAELEKAVKQFLKNVGDRDGGRKMRADNKKSITTWF